MIITVKSVKKKRWLWDAYRGTECDLEHRIVRRVRTPFFDAARYLLETGVGPDTVLELQHKGSQTTAMRGTVGGLAKMAIREDRLGGPLETKFKDFPGLPRSRKPHATR